MRGLNRSEATLTASPVALSIAFFLLFLKCLSALSLLCLRLDGVSRSIERKTVNWALASGRCCGTRFGRAFGKRLFGKSATKVAESVCLPLAPCCT